MSDAPQENLLLAALPEAERRRLDPFLTNIQMEARMGITTPGEPIRHVYFLNDAVTSTVQEMQDGSTVETGLMGVEGLAGVQIWLGVQETVSTTFVQIPGTGFRMTSEDFISEVKNKPSPLNPLIAKYVHAFLILTSLTAACNRLHSVDERLCRWLSMSYNRARRREFPLQQEFMAHMLGVHRPTVSIAAKTLQKAGLIDYKYGKLSILDPEGLAQGACECFPIMEAQFQRVFEGTHSQSVSNGAASHSA